MPWYEPASEDDHVLQAEEAAQKAAEKVEQAESGSEATMMVVEADKPQLGKQVMTSCTKGNMHMYHMIHRSNSRRKRSKKK